MERKWMQKEDKLEFIPALMEERNKNEERNREWKKTNETTEKGKN